jgi:hypothetical protein
MSADLNVIVVVGQSCCAKYASAVKWQEEWSVNTLSGMFKDDDKTRTK